MEEETSDEEIGSLHIIMEGGATAAAGGYDSLLLSDKTLMEKVCHIGIEPVAFPEQENDTDDEA